MPATTPTAHLLLPNGALIHLGTLSMEPDHISRYSKSPPLSPLAPVANLGSDYLPSRQTQAMTYSRGSQAPLHLLVFFVRVTGTPGYSSVNKEKPKDSPSPGFINGGFRFRFHHIQQTENRKVCFSTCCCMSLMFNFMIIFLLLLNISTNFSIILTPENTDQFFLKK